jgi:ribonucleotide reductase alpha subunit
VNLFFGSTEMSILSHMYRGAWRKGLKTTYYLRTRSASNIEKSTAEFQKEISSAVINQGRRRQTLHRRGSPSLLHRSHAEWRDVRGLSVQRAGNECFVIRVFLD